MSEADRANILVVDDVAENIASMAQILGDEHRVIFALNGPDALKTARGEPRPSLILLDVLMPDMDGHEVCRQLKADPRTKGIPVIFLTAHGDVADEERGLRLGAVDYLHKPCHPAIVRQRVRIHLDMHNQTAALEKRVRERTTDIEKTRLEIVRRLARAGQYRDYEAASHGIRMCLYCERLALAAGLPPETAELLLTAASMRDIGKMGIPDDILMKTGRLTGPEQAAMQQHTIIGAEIIGDDGSELLLLARNIALTHHERWDGTGYPNGLAGDGIPIEGRIAAICDTFETMTSGGFNMRVWKPEDACRHIVGEAGRAFDPRLALLFGDLLPEILEIRKQNSEPVEQTDGAQEGQV